MVGGRCGATGARQDRGDQRDAFRNDGQRNRGGRAAGGRKDGRKRQALGAELRVDAAAVLRVVDVARGVKQRPDLRHEQRSGQRDERQQARRTIRQGRGSG